MNFINLFYFPDGYVIIRVTDGDFERFVNICIRRGIRLFRVRERCLKLRRRDFKRLPPIAKKAGVRIKITEKLPSINILLDKKYLLPIMTALVFAVMFLVMSQYVLAIRIEGLENTDRQTLEAAIKSAGISVGMKRSDLLPGSEIKNIILAHTENINWAWAYTQGSKVVIRVREAVEPPELVDKSLDSDLIALRSGVISHVIAKSGTPQVKAGDAVTVGDMLISGDMYSREGEYLHTVRALGEVYAYTRYTKSCEMTLKKEYRMESGKSTTRCYIALGSVRFPRYEEPYELYKSEETELLPNLFCVRYEELIPAELDIDYTQACELAKNSLEEEIASRLTNSAELIDSEFYTTPLSGGKFTATLTMKFIENIAGQTVR